MKSWQMYGLIFGGLGFYAWGEIDHEPFLRLIGAVAVWVAGFAGGLEVGKEDGRKKEQQDRAERLHPELKMTPEEKAIAERDGQIHYRALHEWYMVRKMQRSPTAQELEALKEEVIRPPYGPRRTGEP